MKDNPKPINKYFAFAIILIILILAWLGSYWLKYKNWPWNDLKQAIKRAETEQQKEQLNGEEKINKQEIEEKKSDLFRQGTMNDLAKKIADISPVEPVLGGEWHITRFWFASDRDIYIEYEDGHILRRILIKVEGEPEKPEYKIIAYFEPGENDWVLKQGEDTMFGKPLALYEFDEAEGGWVKKN